MQLHWPDKVQLESKDVRGSQVHTGKLNPNSYNRDNTDSESANIRLTLSLMYKITACVLPWQFGYEWNPERHWSQRGPVNSGLHKHWPAVLHISGTEPTSLQPQSTDKERNKTESNFNRFEVNKKWFHNPHSSVMWQISKWKRTFKENVNIQY